MTIYTALLVASAVVVGLGGGVFYAFSTFVTAGLRELPPDAGATAMKAINRTAERPPLLVLLLSTVVLPAAAAAVGLSTAAEDRWIALTGAIIAVVPLVVTGVGNVPLNNRLDTSSDAGAQWQRGVRPWLRWNHVRTAASAVACALLALAA